RETLHLLRRLYLRPQDEDVEPEANRPVAEHLDPALRSSPQRLRTAQRVPSSLTVRDRPGYVADPEHAARIPAAGSSSLVHEALWVGYLFIGQVVRNRRGPAVGKLARHPQHPGPHRPEPDRDRMRWSRSGVEPLKKVVAAAKGHAAPPTPDRSKHID